MPTLFRAVIRRYHDVERALAFYRDGLDLTVGPHIAGEMYEFPFPNGAIFEVARGGPGATAPVADRKEATDTPIFDVDDVDAAVDRLVALGATIINPPFDLPRRRLAYLADTEGHIIGLGMNRVAQQG